MIEQPKKQAGPHMAQWFYHICSCGRLLAVTGGIIPQHTYIVSQMYGVGPFEYPCDRSGTTHDTMRR